MTTKSGFVAVIGRPNVGKSTLVNQIIESKISIVSDKPQTTRNTVTGIYTDGDIQIVFIDTPGFLKVKSKLSKFMNESIIASKNDADIIVFVVESFKSPSQTEISMLESIKNSKSKVILAINKTDVVSRQTVAEKIVEYTNIFDFDAVVPICAENGENIKPLLEEITGFLEEGPFYFPDDIITNQPLRVIVAEFFREKALIYLKDEIPHGIAVETESFSERTDKDIIDIDLVIYCEKQSHKAIIIGKGGKMLKKILTETRIECEDFFECKINLKGFVKVKEDWRNSDFYLKNFGYTN